VAEVLVAYLRLQLRG